MKPGVWQSFVIFVAKTLTWIYFSGIYQVWSIIYQLMWQRKTAPLQKFVSMDEFVKYIRTFKWRMDSWKELWDAASSAGHVQYLANTDPLRAVGDCDDFAVYEATVLAEQKFEPSIEETFLLNVTWYKYGGFVSPSNGLGFSGHNVCLIKYKNNEGWCYMDYNYPSIMRHTIREIVSDILTRYAPMSWLVRYNVMDRNWNRISTGTE
jgi:hypothetical protein